MSPGNEELLTVEQVRLHLQISRTLAYRLIGNGDIPSLRIGARNIRVRRSDLSDYVDRMKMNNKQSRDGRE